MKKDRNTFFEGYGYNQINSNIPNMNNMIPGNNAVSANSSFYAGPIPNQNMNGYANQNINANMNTNMYNDIDSRISRLEREIDRLNKRVSRLEGDTKIEDYSYNNNSNMYMV